MVQICIVFGGLASLALWIMLEKIYSKICFFWLKSKKNEKKWKKWKKWKKMKKMKKKWKKWKKMKKNKKNGVPGVRGGGLTRVLSRIFEKNWNSKKQKLKQPELGIRCFEIMPSSSCSLETTNFELFISEINNSEFFFSELVFCSP